MVLEKSFNNCWQCPFWSSNDGKIHAFVPGESNCEILDMVKVLVLAEAPAKNEWSASRPLAPQGTAGKRFRTQMERSGLAKIPHYIANVVMCTNLENTSKNRIKNHNPPENVRLRCLSHWQRLVQACRPEVVFLLGATALKSVCPQMDLGKNSFAQIRRESNGSRLNFLPGCPQVVVTHHPSRLTYQAAGNSVWQQFTEDFETVVRLAEKASE
ncbi:uracil-DNA glycosylase family protein [Geoalkalibacter subterraneus]|uniref:Uracil-DNA glycosylase-like domain-containing protein n=1 Tax=Geoalkalibacter subterraneus TaxID=483547 RepID=A0A0B5FX09_9BACT|nr:uracil-DNA glycosylase family protein [Geoalkalibacter subterraneus]AJF08136.1 hypothetical protein GSUB_16645 [Geoalkalibacter subterraneus]